MIRPLFFGVVRGGKLIFEAPAQLSSEIRKYEGRDVQVTIESKRKKRSNAENSYYWAIVVKMVAEFCGYSDEEAHSALKFTFLKKEGKLDTCRSTRELSTVEMEDYLSRIRIYFASEHGLNIPEPNEPIDWG